MDKEWRYERKFFSEALDESQLYQQVKLNSYGFFEEFPERQINNIYYDTEELALYRHHISGSPNRDKIRIRWYGTQREQVIPVLEIKSKRGMVNSKEKFQFNPILLQEWKDEGFTLRRFDNEIVSRFKELSPKIYNSYSRKYFRSFDKKFRITLDFKMSFSDPSRMKICEINDAILELKYAEDHDREASHITQHFPQRLTKYSKYVKAVELTWQLVD
ncbi:MAG: polyphosphate polymerase domain-containing protein [Chitinophagales bacterium]|nr:polyphosphate polymerase domain-containing protein [Chitinophagales bacterium]